MAKLNIGLRQARSLCRMPHYERLAFIAEGLPIILESASGFWAASCKLQEKPREQEVLARFAEEESAKILILLDIVRCPQTRIASRIGVLTGWFYDHLARLIYAQAANWKPMHLAQLREYVDSQRKAHYLEGYAGEYILPNDNIASREGMLYADVEAYEDGVPGWHSPRGYTSTSSVFADWKPAALRVSEAFSALGIFSLRGLGITAERFGALEFKDKENYGDAERLTEALLTQLADEQLITDSVSDTHIREVYSAWQLPMYNLDFKLLDIPMEDLEKERDALLWAEAGYRHDDY